VIDSARRRFDVALVRSPPYAFERHFWDTENYRLVRNRLRHGRTDASGNIYSKENIPVEAGSKSWYIAIWLLCVPNMARCAIAELG
jgi:hypothetical protein